MSSKMPLPGQNAEAEKKADAKSYVCYTGFSIPVKDDPDSDEITGHLKMAPAEPVDNKKIKGRMLTNLIAMGRIVEADSNEGKYIKAKVAKEKELAAATAAKKD